jgi:GNAT superfamily N-acetyltransferase
MTPALEIRRLGNGDLPLLASLHRFLHPQDPALAVVSARGSLRQAATEPGSAVLAGFLDGFPVAAATLIVIASPIRNGAPSALVEALVTHADHRRRGHGVTLLGAALAVAWEAGCQKASLLGGTDDPALRATCAAAGFTPTRTGFVARRVN